MTDKMIYENLISEDAIFNNPMFANLIFGFSYLRLSKEEARSGESASIANQDMIISNYCKANGIILVGKFSDDGWSGGNFDRPGFQDMLDKLKKNPRVTVVVTKDLSRLGRDMMESCYYAERYFPEHGVRYIAVHDNFDTGSGKTNMLVPFQFAMNEVYIRDCSRKVQEVIKAKRENGQYCACPPYGYKKSPHDNNRLIPDEVTAPIVQRIFRQAANGDSSRKIAHALSEEGIMPPLKYRVNNGGNFSAAGASRASDAWNFVTVKRILKNKVYLGDTYLGKTKKVSLKSNKKTQIPKAEWCVTKNTHEPLISQEVFDLAEINMGKGTRDYRQTPHVRHSIFSGVAKCEKCGHALCSSGTVYKGERNKYWFLSCTHARKDYSSRCDGVRVSYYDLLEVVRQDLNRLIAMTDNEIAELTNAVIESRRMKSSSLSLSARKEKLLARQATIRKMLMKLYADNADGKISDDDLQSMSDDLQKESIGISKSLEEIERMSLESADEQEKFDHFFGLIRNFTHIDALDRETLLMFVDKIYVSERVYEEPSKKYVKNQPYTQDIRIVYKFIGELDEPVVANNETVAI